MSEKELIVSQDCMPNIRLFELLIKLRVDELDRETAWQNAVRAKAEFIAERARKRLTKAQQRLIAEVDANRVPPTLPPSGQHQPDPNYTTAPGEESPLPPTGKDATGKAIE